MLLLAGGRLRSVLQFQKRTPNNPWLRECSHSFSPELVQTHLEMIRKHPSQNQHKVPEEYNERLACPRVESALQGLESVVGIRSSDAKELLEYAPSCQVLDEWIERLLSWEGIQRGRDLFWVGHGGFDVMYIYKDLLAKQRTMFALDIVRLFKAPFLRKRCKQVQKQIDTASIRATEIQDALSRIPEMDLVDLIDPKNMTERKKVRYCSTTPPFPLFVRSFPQFFRDNVSYGKTICDTMLLRCVYSGGLSSEAFSVSHSTPFWLVTVQELQFCGYFQEAVTTGVSGNDKMAMRYLQRLLTRPESCPARQHLQRYRDYWNNADMSGSLDELIMAVENNSFPPDIADMRPKPLLQRLRQDCVIREVGEDLAFDYLKELPDILRGGKRLRVLRSKHQIYKVGQKLHNCVGRASMGYMRSVERRQRILVVLEDTDGKPLALGLHLLWGEWNQDGWAAVYEACNQSPSDDTLADYRAYSKVFRRWHRAVFIPSERAKKRSRMASHCGDRLDRGAPSETLITNTQ